MRLSTGIRAVAVLIAICYGRFIFLSLEDGKFARAAIVQPCSHGGSHGVPFNSTCFFLKHPISSRFHDAGFEVFYEIEAGPIFFRSNFDHIYLAALLAGVSAVMVQPGCQRIFVMCEHAFFLGLLELSQLNNPARSVSWNDWNNYLLGIALANCGLLLLEDCVQRVLICFPRTEQHGAFVL